MDDIPRTKVEIVKCFLVVQSKVQNIRRVRYELASCICVKPFRVESDIQYHFQPKLSQESIKLGRDSKLTRLNHSNYRTFL